MDWAAPPPYYSAAGVAAAAGWGVADAAVPAGACYCPADRRTSYAAVVGGGPADGAGCAGPACDEPYDGSSSAGHYPEEDFQWAPELHPVSQQQLAAYNLHTPQVFDVHLGPHSCPCACCSDFPAYSLDSHPSAAAAHHSNPHS